jgi:hypothetical protein
MNALNETEKAYLAGFMDGEGCVAILRQRSGKSISMTYKLVVILVQADRPMLQGLVETLGCGKIYSQRSGAYYHLQFVGALAEEFLLQILPYLRAKRQQAELAIEFRKVSRWKSQGTGSIVDPETNALRERYWMEMRSLRHNGLSENRGRPKHELANN